MRGAALPACCCGSIVRLIRITGITTLAHQYVLYMYVLISRRMASYCKALFTLYTHEVLYTCKSGYGDSCEGSCGEFWAQLIYTSRRSAHGSLNMPRTDSQIVCACYTGRI